jgi:DNA repair exonuclease SbcCD nuclease subunit
VSVSTKVGESEMMVQGVIQEQRGAGWYSVQVNANGKDTILKCRGTQLTQVRDISTEASSSGIPAVAEEESQGILVEPIKRPSIRGPVPPPPTMIDLDAAVQSLHDPLDPLENQTDRDYLRQVAHHMSYTKWVVFTDLHCAPSTLDTTLEVLDRVHKLAVEREAGVLFLGDWWHHRGTLRVDCLNSVLNHLHSWTVPMVMIPGNHDQVTLGGHNHGLTPLENSYRVVVRENTGATSSERETVAGPLVFSHPTKFINGLFVPHIRDNAVMESVLQSHHADKAAAIFIHADVTGAYMNDQIVSLGGVPPSMFPSHKTIYSGHFHKPHLVQSGDVSIEYLGSPYEVSLAEAQQPKALAVLDAADGWKCIERIPLSIGRKHFRALSLDEFLAFQPASGEVDSPVDRTVVNAGDRVVVSMNKGELNDLRRLMDHGEDSVVDAHVKLLRKEGATVEIREVKELPLEAMSIGDAKDAGELEELSLESTWKAYVSGEVRRETLSNASAEALLEAGLEMLEELDADEAPRPHQAQNMTDLKLISVTLEGFGPFKDQASYPLLDRGLVLLSGRNKDGGSDR